MLDFIKAFDWLTLIFCLVLVIRMVIGFFQGGYRVLFKILAFLLGVGLAFALCAPIGKALYMGGVGQSIELNLTNLLGSASSDLSREITKNDLELMHVYWVASGNSGTTQDMVNSMLHEGYAQIFIPQGLYNTLDTIIWNNIPSAGTFTFAHLVALGIAQVGCIAIAFVGILVIVTLIGTVVVEIVYKAKKLAKKKPSTRSRIIGVSLGLVMGLISIWTFSISAKSFITAIPDLWEAFQISMHLNDPGYWSLSKFLFQWEFGYKDLFNWFLSLANFPVAS